MRIDLPCCGFKNCRHCFDGNCMKPSEQEKCEYWYLLHEELYKPETERKKGKWIDYSEDGFVECPFCHSATNCEGNKDELHYCFSCGADMRGGEE